MNDVFHGGRLDIAIAQFGGKKEDWLDLSTGINPNPYPVPELLQDSWHRLPDTNAEDSMLAAATDYYRAADASHLVAANGTQAIIQSLPLMLNQQKIAILAPTYEEHRNSWEKAGRDVSLHCDLDSAVKAGEVVVVVNPNNPTATFYDRNTLIETANRLHEKSGVLIVDEAFADCKPDFSIVPEMPDNVIVLKSFGKFFGLAGLRLGFAICRHEYAQAMRARLGPWNVSGPALEIGAQAFVDIDWIEKTRLEIAQHAQAQVEVLEAFGLKLIGNAGLFMEFEHSSSSQIYTELQRQHILLRPFPDRKESLRFGLCKNMDDLERLAFALKKQAL